EVLPSVSYQCSETPVQLLQLGAALLAPQGFLGNARCQVFGLLGSWRSFFQMRVVPCEDAIQAIKEVLFLMKAVRLTRVNDQLGLDAIALKAAVKLLALA